MISLFCSACERVLPFEAFGGPGHETVCRECEEKAKAAACGLTWTRIGPREVALVNRQAEQLGLFAPKRPAAPAGCARVPGPLCRDGREGRCPGGTKCFELGQQETERIRAAEAEREAGRSALPPPLVVEDLAPEELAAPDLGVGPPDVGCRERTSLFHPTIAEATAAALSDACGACGSTTGAAFYERGPLAGLRRCWPCARPCLEER